MAIEAVAALHHAALTFRELADPVGNTRLHLGMFEMQLRILGIFVSNGIADRKIRIDVEWRVERSSTLIKGKNVTDILQRLVEDTCHLLKMSAVTTGAAAAGFQVTQGAQHMI